MTEQLRELLHQVFPTSGDKKYSALWRVAASNQLPVEFKKRSHGNHYYQHIPHQVVIQLQAMTKEELISLFHQARHHNVGGLPSRANQDEIIQKYFTTLKSYRQDLD